MVARAVARVPRPVARVLGVVARAVGARVPRWLLRCCYAVARVLWLWFARVLLCGLLGYLWWLLWYLGGLLGCC